MRKIIAITAVWIPPVEGPRAYIESYKDGMKAIREADREELSKLRQAIGLLTTLHPTMGMDPDDPITMAHAIHAHVEAEVARPKAEIRTLRNIGVTQAEENEKLKAEVERLTCPYCDHGTFLEYKDVRHSDALIERTCEKCHGTGRAR